MTAEQLRALVVTGAGDAFCAGFDREEFTRPELSDELWSSSDRWHRTVPMMAKIRRRGGITPGATLDL